MIRSSVKFLIIIILGVLSFISFSRSTYRLEGGSFIPSMYYPVSMLFAVIPIVIINKLLDKGTLKSFGVIYVIFLGILIVGSTFMKYCYRPVLEDYYLEYEESNMLNFNDYTKRENNLYTIDKKTKSIIFAKKYITPGFSVAEAKNENNANKELNFIDYNRYDKPVSYYIGNKRKAYLIFYDWKKDEVSKVYSEEKVLTLGKEALSKKVSVAPEYIIGEVMTMVTFTVGEEKIHGFPYLENGELMFAFDKV